MAEGRIQNRSIIQKAAEFLNLEGVKRFPALLDLDNIKAVFDVGRAEGVAAPGGGGGTVTTFHVTGEGSIAGNAEYREFLISAEGAQLTNQKAYRIDALDVELTVDAAGASAINGVSIFLELYFNAATGDPPNKYRIVAMDPVWIGATSVLQYRWALRGYSANLTPFGISSDWNGRVDKSDLSLEIKFRVRTGVFPANSTIKIGMLGRVSTNGAVPEN